MKKKIAILGSTGSIGKSLLKIIEKDPKKFEIVLLSAKKNYNLLLNQAKKFKVKKIIISDEKYYNISIKKRIKGIKIYKNFNHFNNIFSSKIDYVMSSIVGIEGLDPTIKIIKYTKKIAIANKESIICGWNLIKKELDKYETRFVPVDSEHFSTWYALRNNSVKNIEKIYLTASGGSLLNISKDRYNKLSIKDILNHPNWKMGKKITIDSSTLMNKVFEIIEAKKIFNVKYNQLDILIHPLSYIHAIIKFRDGMIKIIAHDTTMEIPIYNTLYDAPLKFNTKKIDINKLNNLDLNFVNTNKFLATKIINKMPETTSLFETVLVSANDEFVKLFLNKKIKYSDILLKLFKIINKKDLIKLKKIVPRKVADVINVNQIVHNKIKSIN